MYVCMCAYVCVCVCACVCACVCLCVRLFCCALHCFALHCFAMLCFALHCILRSILLGTALLCIALLCSALLCLALRSDKYQTFWRFPFRVKRGLIIAPTPADTASAHQLFTHTNSACESRFYAENLDAAVTSFWVKVALTWMKSAANFTPSNLDN